MSGEDRSWMDNQRNPQGAVTDEFRRDMSSFGGRASSFGGRGSGIGAGAGAGRGSGRQRIGKWWLVKDCPTAITGIVPQPTISEATDDSSPLTPGEQTSVPPLPAKVSGKFYEEPKFDERNRYILEILDDYTFLHHGAPDPARWLHDKFHNSNFEEFYKTVSELPEDIIARWFESFEDEYCRPSQNDIFYTAFKAMVSNRYKSIINKIREKWMTKKSKPVCFTNEVWEKWLVWWDSDEFKKISERNRKNRNFNGGVASLHTGGSISCGEQLYRMKKVHGDHIDAADMFAAMHTRKGPTEGQLTWVSPVSENFYGQYKEAAREKAISEGLISADDGLDTRIPFQPSVWEATAISNSKSQGKRAKRGDQIYGFGRHGKQLIKLSSSSRPRSSLLSHSFQTSSAPDPEKEQLREEVSNLKEMMQQMQEREKKREQQQQEEQRQVHQFMQQMMGGHLQHQQRLNPSFINYFPPGGMYIQQQQLQPFHQQFNGQTLPPPNGGTSGMLDLLLDPNYNSVGGVGGSGGVGSHSGSGSDNGV